INYADRSWLLVRKSGTEPKIRIYGESTTYDDLKKRINELIIEANKVLKEKGLREVRVDGKIIP
ncbi:MAG: hypothetical protein ACP5KB_05620, partial [Thermoprotei archaeon]